MVQLSAKAGEEALGADGLISELWWSRKSRKKKDPEKTKLLQLCLTMVDRRKVEKYPAAKAKSRSLKEISWINQRLKLQRKKTWRGWWIRRGKIKSEGKTQFEILQALLMGFPESCGVKYFMHLTEFPCLVFHLSHTFDVSTTEGLMKVVWSYITLKTVRASSGSAEAPLRNALLVHFPLLFYLDHFSPFNFCFETSPNEAKPTELHSL